MKVIKAVFGVLLGLALCLAFAEYDVGNPALDACCNLCWLLVAVLCGIVMERTKKFEQEVKNER